MESLSLPHDAKAKETARNEAFKKNETYNNADRKLQQVINDERSEASRYRSEYDRLTNEKKRTQSTIEGYKQMQRLRDPTYEMLKQSNSQTQTGEW